MQNSKLLSTFRDFKRRQAAALGPYYAARLEALERDLLATREELFTRDVDTGASEQPHLQAVLQRAAALEREVAEVGVGPGGVGL